LMGDTLQTTHEAGGQPEKGEAGDRAKDAPDLLPLPTRPVSPSQPISDTVASAHATPGIGVGSGAAPLEPLGPNATREKPGVRSRIMAGISRNVLVLGAVSFFTDVSSEMIVPIRIIFLVLVLRTPLPLAGLIEGVAESTASLLKIVAGRMSDRPSSRKPLMLFGYGVSNGVKPLLAFVSGWPPALLLIFLDRVGKGVRGSPRDAMMADSTPRQYMGKAFGFHRSMDTFGAAVGPLITYFILLVTAGDLSAVFLWTAVPGALSVLIILVFLRDRGKPQQEGANASAPASSPQKVERKVSVPARVLGTRFWMFTAISAVFAIGNSSDAFIFLRTAGLESSILAVPLIYFAYNMVYAVFATPLGALSDRLGRLPVLVTGYVAFGLVYLGWAVATEAWNAWVLFLVYGIYAAATEGVGKAFVADIVPKEYRGTAMGWFNGLTGFAALPANLVGGWLWSVAGAPATFMFGGWTSAVAVALVIAWLPWLRRNPELSMIENSAARA
ncbi:MAG TPA: MFS transporter, partial [Chloroflexia bacterium]